MNLMDALHMSSSGLSAQRIRMNLISSNLANVNTTRTKGGGPYKRKDPIFAALPMEKSFNEVLKNSFDNHLNEVQVIDVKEDNRKPVSKYEPTHPDANDKGYVLMPNVNVMEEMVNMMMATRSYEANVTAISATKKMALKALEIGQ